MQRRFQKSNYATLINLKKDLVPSALVFTIQRAISVFQLSPVRNNIGLIHLVLRIDCLFKTCKYLLVLLLIHVTYP